MKILNIFALLSMFLIIGCGEKKEEEILIDKPTSLRYEAEFLELEKNIPLNFMFPSVVGEKLSFYARPLLPRGLFLNPSNGTIAGIPLEVSPENTYTIYAENSSGSSTFNIRIIVNERPVPSISFNQSKYFFTKGVPIDPVTIISEGADFSSYRILKVLPSGLVFDEQLGRLSGTPTQIITNYTSSVEGITERGSAFATISFDIRDIPPETLFYPISQLVLRRDTQMESSFPISSGGAVINYSVSPSLPNGLNFNTTTGEISGTPLSARVPSNFTITASNSGGSTSTTISLEVQDLPPQGITYGASNFIFTKTISINSIFPSIISGGIATSYAISPSLPNGLNFNTTTGEISGTPLEKHPSTNYTVSASNNGGSTSSQINIFVKDLPPQDLSYDIVSNIYVKNNPIQMLSPSSSGGEILSYAISPSLPNGLNFNETTGIISGTPSTTAEAQSYTVTAINNQGTSQYSFFISIKDEAPRDLTYNQEDLVLTKGTLMPEINPQNEGGLITSYVSTPALPAGIIINKTTGIISGAPSQVIPRTPFVIRGSNATGETNRTIYLIINDIAPTNLSYGLNNYTFDRGINIPSLFAFNSGGTIVNYSVNPPLPSGLNFNTTTGEISGIPMVHITNEVFTVTGINTGGSVSVDVNLTINDFPPENLFYGGVPYRFKKNNSLGEQGIVPAYSGGAITTFFINPALPEGLFIDENTGAIKGIPTEKTSEFIQYTVTGVNSGGSTTGIVTINITDEDPIVSYNFNEYSYFRLDNVEIIPNLSGGEVTLWTITPEALPDGISFNTSTGSITGVPTETLIETQEYSILAMNDGGTVVNNLSLTILPIPPSNISYPNNNYEFPKEVRSDPQDPLTSNYLEPILITPTIDGDDVDLWEIEPVLPDGLILNSLTGEISGIPTEGTSLINYEIKAKNSGGEANYILSMIIRDVPPTNLEYLPDSYVLDTGDDIFIAAPFNEGGDIKIYSIAPSLPAGLSFNTLTGEIEKIGNLTGQPITEYIITGSNDEGATSTSLFIALADSPPTNLVYGEEDSPYGQAVSYFTYGIESSFIPSNDGGAILDYQDIQYYRIDKGPDYLNNREDTIKVEIGTIPSGLTFNNLTGELGGTILKNSTSDNKFYGLDVQGTNDGGTTFTYTLIYFNDRPVPFAGDNFEGTIGELQILQGENFDEDNDDDEWPFPDTNVGRLQNYEWFLVSKPASSSLTNSNINNRFSQNPSFIPDRIGEYVFELETDDGLAKSQFRDSVTVTIVDVPPSNLTYGSSPYGFDNFLYNVGDSVVLNPSSDGGDVVSYSISQPLPAGLNFNNVTGIISGTINDSFEPLTFSITATNTGGSTSKNIKIWGNKKPSAIISVASNKLNFGNSLILDGSESFDEDFSFSQQAPYSIIPVSISYSWSVISKPINSNISDSNFSNSSGEITAINPDVKGNYIFGLTINDGYIDSDLITVNITVASAPQNINYGSIGYGINNFVYNTGESLSIVPTFEGDPSIFSISPSLPAGISLNTNSGEIFGSSSNYAESRIYTVTATNGGGSSSVNVRFWINNQPEIIFQQELTNLIVGESYVLNSVSIDDIDNGNINIPPFSSLSDNFNWKLIGIPSGSSLSLANVSGNDSVNLEFTPDVEGEYIFSLLYNDGLINSSNEAVISLVTQNHLEDDRPIIKIKNNDYIREVLINEEVDLDLTESIIKKGSAIYNWEIISKPNSSNALINDELSSQTFIEIDEEGYYLIKATISDGIDYSSAYISLYTNSAITEITGGVILENLTLSLENSPYLLLNSLEVTNGASLSIEEGVLLIGGGNEIRVSNGFLLSTSIDKNIFMKDVRINSGNSSNTDFEIVNNYLENSSFCELGFNGSQQCSGRFVFRKNTMLNSKIIDSSIGNSIKEIEISENVFINSHGFEVLTLSNPIMIKNNYISNPRGGRVSLDPYLLIINQNNTNAIRVNNNYFDDSNINNYKYIRINPSLTTNVDLINNNWNNYKEINDFISWILNYNKANIIPLSTDISENTPLGLQYR